MGCGVAPCELQCTDHSIKGPQARRPTCMYVGAGGTRSGPTRGRVPVSRYFVWRLVRQAINVPRCCVVPFGLGSHPCSFLGHPAHPLPPRRAQRSTFLKTPPRERFVINSVTIALRGSLYHTPLDYVRAGLEVRLVGAALPACRTACHGHQAILHHRVGLYIIGSASFQCWRSVGCSQR